MDLTLAHEYKTGLFQELPCPSWMKMYEALGKNACDVAVKRWCASLSGYLLKGRLLIMWGEHVIQRPVAGPGNMHFNIFNAAVVQFCCG